MEEKYPKAMCLFDEAEIIIEQINSRLSHVLLPNFPNPAGESKTDTAESQITYKARRLVRQLREISDRIES